MSLPHFEPESVAARTLNENPTRDRNNRGAPEGGGVIIRGGGAEKTPVTTALVRKFYRRAYQIS